MTISELGSLGELIGSIKLSAARFVTAQQGVRPGANDELIAWIIAAAGEHGPLYGHQNVSFIGAGARELQPGLQGLIGPLIVLIPKVRRQGGGRKEIEDKDQAKRHDAAQSVGADERGS